MGYYTDYQLTVSRVPDELTAMNISKWLEDKQLLNYAFDKVYDYWEKDHILDFSAYSEAKWYDHDDDMVELSKAFPDCVFRLYGSGENTEDVWNAYYKNGSIEYCEMIIPEPTEIEWP